MTPAAPQAEPAPSQAPRIRARRRGNRLGFWFFRMALRLHGLRGAYGLAYFVGLHYWLFDRAAARASLPYIRRRFRSHGAVRGALDLYRLYVAQGRHLIDRYCLLTGYGRWDLRLQGREAIQPLVDEGRGFVLLNAHVGNWQAVMDCLKGFGRPVNFLMRPEDNPAVEETLRVTENRERFRIVSPEGFMGGAMEITACLQRGEIVSIMGDRVYDFNAATVEFLGEPARFPCGAFHIAAVTRSPVVVLFSAKTGLWRYDVFVAAVFHPEYVRGRPKADQLRDFVQGFVRVLEDFVQRHPFQCFLFHDVWAAE